MNLSIATSIAVMLIGLAMYLLANRAKVVELGRIMFAVGLFVSLLRFAGTAGVHLSQLVSSPQFPLATF